MASETIRVESGKGVKGSGDIIFENGNVHLLKEKNVILNLAWGEMSGTKNPKITFKVTHPEKEKSKEYNAVFEDDAWSQVRSTDMTNKTGINGKTSWLMEAHENHIAAADMLSKTIAEEITSLETASVLSKVVAKGGAKKGITTWEHKPVGDDKSIAEFVLGNAGHREGPNFFKEVWENMELGKRKPSELTADEQRDFRANLKARILGPREPDADEEDKDGHKPWMKSLAMASRGEDDTAPRKYPMSLQNFKAGAATKSTSTDEDLAQTNIFMVPVGADGVRDILGRKKLTVEEALPYLMHNSGGTGRDGFAKDAFFIEVKKRWRVKHWWVNSKGINPSVELETLEFSVMPAVESLADRPIGNEYAEALAVKTEAENRAKVAEAPAAAPAVPTEPAEAPVPDEDEPAAKAAKTE